MESTRQVSENTETWLYGESVFIDILHQQQEERDTKEEPNIRTSGLMHFYPLHRNLFL